MSATPNGCQQAGMHLHGIYGSIFTFNICAHSNNKKPNEQLMINYPNKHQQYTNKAQYVIGKYEY